MFSRFFQSKVFTFLSLVAISLFAWALFKMEPQRIMVEKRMKSLQDKITEMERSNTELGHLLGYFKSDAYLEREAKLKLNVRRPEESVVFLQERDTNPTISSVPEEPHPKMWGINFLVNLNQWLRNLFK